ncbi:MAG TPA: RsmE family RNA methyltransferase [Chitinophagaceae bacterium]
MTSTTMIRSDPFFYIESYEPGGTQLRPGPETSKHIVQVLRMRPGQELYLTDGKGLLIRGRLETVDRKDALIGISQITNLPRSSRKVIVAVSLLKNTSRFEWFLEKATELGVAAIIPLICKRSERQSFRSDRMKNVLVSAMLQSEQCWLPVLHEPVDYASLFQQPDILGVSQRFIAHCMPGAKRNLADLVNESLPSQIILIGPEGDFTEEEVSIASDQYRFDAVSLGVTRLRTETAALVAATILIVG